VPVDVTELGADFYAFSIYKLYGPHVGCVVAAPELLADLRPLKLAPAPAHAPNSFERGTPAIEALAGVTAAIDWLAGLTDAGGGRRERVLAAFSAAETRLAGLLARALDGLAELDRVRLLGAARRRTSTLSFLVDGRTPREVARALAERGVAVWDGDNYAYELMRRYGLDQTGGAVRASIVLYNDERDIDRLLEALTAL
jgi:selenocysteine lyase/cysteine desulfurase